MSGEKFAGVLLTPAEVLQRGQWGSGTSRASLSFTKSQTQNLNPNKQQEQLPLTGRNLQQSGDYAGGLMDRWLKEEKKERLM